MHVGIVGGGISGLYCALLLRRESHQVTVFERSDRVGGRIYTHYFTAGQDEYVFFEAGAMRIPLSPLHRLVYDLIRYANEHGAPEDAIELIPYILEHENNDVYVRNQKFGINDASLAKQMNLPTEYQRKTAKELLGEVIKPWLIVLRQDFETGFQKALLYDEYSFRAYLRAIIGWPHEVIEYVELMTSQTNQFDFSFTEIIVQNLDFDTLDWVTIRNGVSRLAQSAANLLGNHLIRLDTRVDSIIERADGRICLHMTGKAEPYGTFDKIVLAIPPAALHHIKERPTWSFMKEQSIRGFHYEPLYKIGLHFRSRFWEHTSRLSFSGQSTTDLRFHWIVYPSNDLEHRGSGVLLLYCWMTDASSWNSMSKEERVQLALQDLDRFFRNDGVDVYKQYIEAWDISWSCEGATGDAQFLPGQFSRFHEIANRLEGNIHCAGEHLSKHHTWISGALDSALTTTRNMLGNQDLAPIGRERTSVARVRPLRETDISSHHLASVIPHHMNVQYAVV